MIRLSKLLYALQLVLCVLILLLFSTTLSSQNKFEVVTITKSDNTSLEGSGKKLPSRYSFLLEFIDDNGNNEKFSAQDLSSIRFQDGTVYKSSKISLSPLVEEYVFLEVLVAGDVDLLYFVDDVLKERFFISNKSGELRELIEESKTVRNAKGELVKRVSKRYLGELNFLFSTCTDSNFKSQINKVKLEKKDLVNLFVRYHECLGKSVETFDNKKREKLTFAVDAYAGRSRLWLRTINNKISVFTTEFSYGTIIGFAVKYYLPRSLGRYALSVGYFRSTYTEVGVGDNVSFSTFPISLTRFVEFNDRYKLALTAGLQRSFLVRNNNGVLIGLGHEFALIKNRVKLFNNLNYRFSAFPRADVNLGLRVQI